MPRYLTKSRFKLATECPTKLFYTGKNTYPDTKMDDPFLASLADGGFQVGELAKCYYPDGHDIKTLDYQESIAQTNKLLQQENIVIFEPAIHYLNLFIRVDILVKKGNKIELIEVKAKSYSAQNDRDFIGARGGLSSHWKPYIFDVAFQKYVIKKALPTAIVTSYLMLVDKNSLCPSNGLNQKFKLVRNSNNRRSVEVTQPLSDIEYSKKILKKVNTDKAVQLAYDKYLQTGFPTKSFIDNIHALADYYERDEKIAPIIGSKCKHCEFKATTSEEIEGKISGFKECWKQQLHWQDRDFDTPTVLDIANFRKADNFIAAGKIKLTDLTKDDLEIKESTHPALTRTERQWLQVKRVQDNETAAYLDFDSMRNEMKNWSYPLHFIDFETCATAIPFFEGMRPYETIAFQFSHHMLHEDGRIEHAGQFLSTQVDNFPNFEFIRALKEQLDKDNGTIFRFHNHENTTLNKIREQLLASNESDKEELCEFIKSITKSPSTGKEHWRGERCMVDQCQLIIDYFYDPATNGSNSIKAVFPAILNSSDYLKTKYVKAIYGSEHVPSYNFKNKVWIELNQDGKVKDPYKSLPKLFADASEHDIELLSEVDELNNGGLALTAYAKLQFTEMSAYERAELEKGLLMYCELDTLAMVMIHEAWREMLKEYEQFIQDFECLIDDL